ncbi:hypothetical protein CBR_g5640 [Chara braunii]|nr:hypothetical protein CBR_g5640 [Chara braunii]|eukprot:GBG60467.1 hypothetical protein CBR_g5640 [Chara braunii]
MAGTFSIFPGKQAPGTYPYNCEEYDPRQRPWFTEAISPRKNVAILVDLRKAMDDPIGPLMAGLTRLKVVQATLRKLMKTFGEGDGVSITTYPPSNFSTDPETVQQIDQPTRLEHFGKSVEAMATVTNVLAPDLSEGMSAALQSLSLMRQGASENPVEVLLVFTFGKVGVENAIQVIKGYNSTAPQTPAPPAVFLYGVAIQEPVAFQNLSDIAYNVGGLAKNVGTGDYLLGIYSYFNYLSRFYAYANGTVARWARRYADAFDMGNITTLVMPGHIRRTTWVERCAPEGYTAWDAVVTAECMIGDESMLMWHLAEVALHCVLTSAQSEERRSRQRGNVSFHLAESKEPIRALFNDFSKTTFPENDLLSNPQGSERRANQGSFQ